ncbi:MAG: quercetin 2,3-dioxygenase [Desulfuromonas sp.]|nr:MAG: quercetin 2,3-dioxygenase [Desulfuromonas sp.]
MITLRPAEERGQGRQSWLESRHSFSFADYYDPRHMGFRSLRVINQDIVQPNHGFPLHPHSDMEILSLVLEGTLQHRDNMGNEGNIPAGALQRMTAGTGIMHSEWNPSADDVVHFLQIWLLPERKGLDPGYEQWEPPSGNELPGWSLLTSNDARDGSVKVCQDVDLWRVLIQESGQGSFTLRGQRAAWLQVISGRLRVNGKQLSAGDGAAVEQEETLIMTSDLGVDFLLFDLG